MKLDSQDLMQQTLVSLCRDWNDLALESKRDVALPPSADESALSALLLAVEVGNSFPATAIEECEKNVQLAISRWSNPLFANADALLWRLCIPNTRREEIRYLVRNLSHGNSAVRIWMMKLAWLIHPWLQADDVMPHLLKNIADTLGGIRMNMGLASVLCQPSELLEKYIAEYESEDFPDQFNKRIEQFRSEGFTLSQWYFWMMETRCRKRIQSVMLLAAKNGSTS